MIYEYICKKCGKKIEKIRSVSQRHDHVKCIHDNENMELVILNIFVTTGLDHNVGS